MKKFVCQKCSSLIEPVVLGDSAVTRISVVAVFEVQGPRKAVFETA